MERSLWVLQGVVCVEVGMRRPQQQQQRQQPSRLQLPHLSKLEVSCMLELLCSRQTCLGTVLAVHLRRHE